MNAAFHLEQMHQDLGRACEEKQMGVAMSMWKIDCPRKSHRLAKVWCSLGNTDDVLLPENQV
jgi:hypothetical protein